MEKIGIVGSGLMGTGIAYVTARQLNAEVVVIDVSDDLLKKGSASCASMGARAIEKGQSTQQQVDAVLKRLRFTVDKTQIKGASFVIEAVSENIDLKRRIFAELDEICGDDDTVIATNTTGLPITQIAAATRHPDRVIGTHFFNPVPVMKLVELVRGYLTSAETVERTKDFCSRLGKETIVVEKDFPGFITTRIMQGYLTEALRCLEQGISSAEDIDKGCKLAYNHPMGPFELMDLIGLDTVLSVTQSMQDAYGENHRVSPLLRQLVGAGRLGRKTGAGFHTYKKKA
jgi:3-hydroxybutyryl-CoA dehydrogenase